MLGGLVKKIEFIKENGLMVAAGAILVIAIGLYFIFFIPVQRELKAQFLECKDCEDDVVQTRNIIEFAGKVYSKRVLATEKEVSQILDELTKYGRMKGIDFVSIKPGEVVLADKYKILSVEIAVESTYRELSAFLGSLDDLDKGVVKVKSFNIVPDEEDPWKSTADLVIDIYLSARDTG